MKTLNKQSTLDLALQTSGHVEGVMGLAQENEISITEVLEPAQALETKDVAVLDSDIQGFYSGRKIRPATESGVGGEKECDYCNYFM